MKYLVHYLSLILLCLSASCAKDEKQTAILEEEEEKTNSSLPFTTIDLNDMSAFKPVSKNWNIVSDATADRVKKQRFTSNPGTGILLNTPEKGMNDNLFTNFEHGDIELELDVMMPLESNSGIYFQGRYEIQLLDSWGVNEPKHSDIGGIYQRWNDNAEKDKQGFQGHPPKSNAAKAPGLWQHFKIIFHAPQFDASGNKIKNAWFEEVWLNGMLLHENVEVKGPTRAAAFEDEKALGPIMMQGDHGAVAFKNIKYKRYDAKTLTIKNTTLTVFENPDRRRTITQPGLDTLKVTSKIKTDSISPMMRINKNDESILSYSGTFGIPNSGDYLFNMRVNGGAILLINNDTIISMNKDHDMNTKSYGLVNLQEGDVPYTLIYNKPVPWKRGFDVYVEGPNIQEYSILETSVADINKKTPITTPITLEVSDRPLTQRSFVTHEGSKRTHCISVGLVEGLNYTSDLATGSLLYVWGGDFLNTTQMWHSRGEHQRGEPMGFTVSFHGDLDFAFLKNDNDSWPKKSNDNINFKSSGYEFKDGNIPEFSFKINDSEISNSFIASKTSKRGLTRVITVNSKTTIWHKIAEGKSIKALGNNTFIVNNESYYIEFSASKSIKPIIRSKNGKDELLVKISNGNETFNYTIIW